MDDHQSDNVQADDFDFDQHREIATQHYRSLRGLYLEFAETSKRILTESLRAEQIRVHSIEARAKTFDSFGKKVTKPSESDPNQPKYPDPVNDITDLAGIRVIAFFPRTLQEVCRIIESEFLVIEKTDKGQELVDEEKFGYQSIHYLVKMKPERSELPEYRRFSGLTAEIQVRTILQHAWAEMGHDIQYRSVSVIPSLIRRRFMALAGMLEIADREFQAIQDEDESLRQTARVSVETGNFEEVEITPDSLKSYLDRQFGEDGRMTHFSYEFTARMLKKTGFSTIEQIDESIKGYDDDRISRILWGGRMGQITRFEDTLLAAMGENFGNLHPWGKEDWFKNRIPQQLAKLRAKGIDIGNYIPEMKIESE